MTITDFKELNESGLYFDGYALVKSAQEATTKGGVPFFNITLGKQEKSISTKLWENKFNNHDLAQLKRVFENGNVLHIKGKLSEYRDQLQLTIDEFAFPEEGAVQVEDYLESAPEPIESLREEYENYIANMDSPVLKEICQRLYDEHKDKFITYPAAKSNHHCFTGGLLYHTVSMLRLGDHISGQYKEVKKDLVMAGIALHDMGKVVEYTNYFAPDYSKVGNFLGHITIINMFIDRKVQVLKEEMPWTRKEADEVYELMHVINAHHGKLEYGSPVESKILEAEVVHQIDMMDSRINMITYGLQDENLQENEAKRIFPMGLYYRTSQD